MPKMKKYQSNAERQKAYNERKRNKKGVTFLDLFERFKCDWWSMTDAELMELNRLAKRLENGTHTVLANRKQLRNLYDEDFIRYKEQGYNLNHWFAGH